MPVPPVYEPEIAADAMVWASRHPRREFLVGGSTVLSMVGNKLAPRVADRYLARTNIQAQQAKETIPPDRPDYLYAPLPGDPGASNTSPRSARPHGGRRGAGRACRRPLVSRSARRSHAGA
jgi:hypothetical protein